MKKKKKHALSLPNRNEVFLYRFQKGKYVTRLAKVTTKQGKLRLSVNNKNYGPKSFTKSKWSIRGGIAALLLKLRKAGFKNYEPTDKEILEISKAQAKRNQRLAKRKVKRQKKRRIKDSPYFNAKGDAIIRESGCIVADVLGFSEIIRSSVEDGEGEQVLLKFISILDKSVNQMEENKRWTLKSPQWTFKFYSDNLIIGFPISENSDDESAESEIGRTILITAEHQLKLACEGFFIRGGFSYGDLHVSQNMVVGKAMLDAHDIEVKVANHPRVVLHESILPKIDLQVGFGGSPLLSLLLIDEDGHIFLNYLDMTLPDPGIFCDELLMKHRNEIVRRLEQNKDNATVYSKYVWLGKYHNFFCDNFVDESYGGLGFDVGPFRIENIAAGELKFLATRYPKDQKSKGG